jgi:hypothetical protein
MCICTQIYINVYLYIYILPEHYSSSSQTDRKFRNKLRFLISVIVNININSCYRCYY